MTDDRMPGLAMYLWKQKEAGVYAHKLADDSYVFPVDAAIRKFFPRLNPSISTAIRLFEGGPPLAPNGYLCVEYFGGEPAKA